MSEMQKLDESEALAVLAGITDLPLLEGSLSIQGGGLIPAALAAEYKRGRQMAGNGKLLAGVELVEIPGISSLDDGQIEADLRALKAVGADGLALSWDLWHMPLGRLDLVRSVWYADGL